MIIVPISITFSTTQSLISASPHIYLLLYIEWRDTTLRNFYRCDYGSIVRVVVPICCRFFQMRVRTDTGMVHLGSGRIRWTACLKHSERDRCCHSLLIGFVPFLWGLGLGSYSGLVYRDVIIYIVGWRLASFCTCYDCGRFRSTRGRDLRRIGVRVFRGLRVPWKELISPWFSLLFKL